MAATIRVLYASHPPARASCPATSSRSSTGRPAAEEAIAWVVDSGLAASVKITLLGLLGITPGIDSDEPTMGRELAGAMRAGAMDALDQLAESLQGRSESLAVVMEIGHPVEGALRAIDDLGPDLVVVTRPPGRRGQDPFAEKIARHAPTSVPRGSPGMTRSR